MKHVVILQHRLLHYRVKLFERLRDECFKRGIKLDLVHGQASKRDEIRNDEGSIPWAYAVRNTYFDVAGKDLIWQPYPARLRDADLVILMQENKLLSNYTWLVKRLWSKRSIGFWGHGKNFQSTAPNGLRESWKAFILTKVDWWFAYTKMTVNILSDAGFSQDSITVLNNAVDTAGFRDDLASWSDEDLNRERIELGLNVSSRVGLFCGSLYAEKKLDTLLEAADLVRARIPQFFLLIIGDGPSMAWLKNAVESRPWIKILGVCTGRKKALYFRMAEVQLNPGLVGLHIVDAFCASLVLVTTRGAMHSPEVVYLDHGRNGVLTDDDPQSYGEAVVELLSNRDLLTRLRLNSKAESVVYTLENMVDRFVDGISSALTKKSYRRRLLE